VAVAALDEVHRLPGGGVGFILLGDASTGGLTTPEGLLPGPFSAVTLGEGIIGTIAQGEPEIVNNVAADSRRSDPEHGTGSLIGAPLRARGETIGVIGAATTAPHDYRSGDLKVLTAIAALTGPAIDAAAGRTLARRI
jgi:GAF domain-containing protein